MTSKYASPLLTGVAALLVVTGSAIAQPTLSPQGGGSADAEMDHSRMGGQGQATRPGTPAPTLTPQGGGSADAAMDHSRMGGGNMGSPSGGTITGNSGSGGPEVQHGHGPATPQPRRTN
ncbi:MULTISPECIES: hypothetical protein [Roseicella]|uniref:Uncharacterized protein n=1 Tax=Roseicella aquatilis TaxID=2527868 RepID=A0A4R4D8V5_9PROT|nr:MULTISPECIES: hypothetical protein [Roseicella]NOG73566.1 hypothetical protein [Roseicella sp. DB1501]TCZ55811.1 hypothetical protein EXY23_21025 [Roseicella aquatilis]